MADQPKIIISAVDNTRAAFSSVKAGLGQIEGVGSTLNGVIGKLAPLLGAATFTSFIKGGIDTLDMLGDLSDRTGVAASTLSGFQLVAAQSDTSLESLGKGLNKLSIYMAENAEAATKLGITAKDPAEAFIQLSDVLTNIESPQQRAALANKILGKSYQELLPALLQGGDALRTQIENGKAVTGVTDENVKKAKEFNDQLDLLKTKASNAGVGIASNLLPSLNEITNTFIENNKKAGLFLATLSTIGNVIKIATVGTDQANAEKRQIQLIGIIAEREKALKKAESDGTDDLVRKNMRININKFRDELAQITAQLESNYAKDHPLKPKLANNNAVIESIINPDKEAKKSTGKSDAQKYSEDVASLIQSLQQASDPAQSVSEKLQDQLDAYKYLDPAVKTYLQGLIDQKSATDQLIESQKQQNTLDEAMRKWDIEQAEIEQKQIDSMNEKAEAIKRGLDPTIELTEAQGELNEMVEKGLISQEEADKYFKKLKDNALDTTGFMRDLGATFNSAFEDAIVNGQKFSNVLGGLAQDIERLFVRRLITDPFMKGLDSLVLGPLSDSFGGFFANAAGGVYAGAGISAYSGQLVSSPTVFPFAKGIGLMGEAGPEAILPLRRGSNGKLGVEASRHGGEITYNVEINIDANRNSDVKANGASASELGRQIDAAVRKVLIKEKMNGGILS